MDDFAQMLRQAADEQHLMMSTNLADIFSEEPVSLPCFLQDQKFLGNPPLSPVQYEAVRHIERIYLPNLYPQMAELDAKKKMGTLHVGPVSTWRDEPYWSIPYRMTNFITLQWGKGSGKDHVARVACMRIAYLLLCLESPQNYYGMPEQDTIHLLNVASNSHQARDAFFTPMTKAVRTGWFKHRADPKQNVIDYDKNISSISGHSDAESQEGLNLLLAVADEIDAFRSKKEVIARRGAAGREPTKSAEGILNMMRSSGITRFPKVFKNVRISFPRYLGSTIQQLTTEAKKDLNSHGNSSRHYVSGPLATWEVNPRVTGPEDFAQEYMDDPVMARAKYECKPARAVNPYFRNIMAVDAAFRKRTQAPVEIDYRVEDHDGDRPVWVPSYVFADDFFPVRGAMYAMHGDLAVTADRAGIAMAHVVSFSEHETVAEDEDGATHVVREVRPHVKVDFVLSFTADASADPPREIQIRWARQLCFELIRRGFNIKRFTFDVFQCLSGDVEIPLLDGTSRKLRELEGKAPFWVYSIKDGRIVPGLCTKAWRTGYRDDMVEVELDNGETVRSTSDHLFMLRDGTYRQAELLQPGDSLMPLYRRQRRVSQDTALYEQVRHPEPDGSGKRWRYTHSMVSHAVYGALSKGWVTHHRNFDELDNSPENLEQMPSARHSALHRALGVETFQRLWADPEWAAAHRQRISAVLSQVQAGKVGKDSRRYRQDLTIEVIRHAHQQCLSEGVIPSRDEMQRRLQCSQGPLYGRIREAGYRSWKAFRDAHETVSAQALYMRGWKARQRDNNHRVVAVRPAPPEDVFDLQVEEHHNFAIAAGVFVHNSTDSMQILQSKGIDCERVSTDMSEDPYRSLRDLMYEGRLSIPRPPVAADQSFLLRDELLSLTRLPNGRIDHPVEGSKDESDALACASYGAVIIGGSEEESGARAQYTAPDITVSSHYELPLGMNLKRIWSRELPSTF